jgi:hypothetical protein
MYTFLQGPGMYGTRYRLASRLGRAALETSGLVGEDSPFQRRRAAWGIGQSTRSLHAVRAQP